ncbi:hypothetical protein N7528_003926 [Penicillium herquei]|nr:hypothetical protein N7528_003926 [Penicillium herquei]
MDLLIQRFSHRRGQFVQALDGYVANIMEHKTEYYRDIATDLEYKAKAVESLTRTMITGSGITLRLPLCVRERILRVQICLENFREILILEKDKPQHEIIDILVIISTHVGRIKPVGSHVADPYADGMDWEIRELERLYGKGSPACTCEHFAGDSLEDIDLKSPWQYWEALNYSDSWCGCSYCKIR